MRVPPAVRVRRQRLRCLESADIINERPLRGIGELVSIKLLGTMSNRSGDGGTSAACDTVFGD